VDSRQDSLEQLRRQQAALITPERLERILDRALPNRAFSSFELLPGGSTNLNYLVRFNETHAPAVLRIYVRDREACSKELALISSAARLLPVPEILFADANGHEDIGPHILYRFAEGITFHELKSRGNPQDVADAAYAIGQSLAQVGTVAYSPATLCPAYRRYASTECLDPALLEERLGGWMRDRLFAVASDNAGRLAGLNEENALVHGDFNNRNAIVKFERGRWAVSGILNWEMAFSGSPLWDAARFTCYERPGRPRREPHFSRGFTDGGGSLPADWSHFARVVSVISAAESLSRVDLRPHFVPELCELVGLLLDDIEMAA
jgi:aminoglycoside phosphotransferase (APT) family kinase protein